MHEFLPHLMLNFNHFLRNYVFDSVEDGRLFGWGFGQDGRLGLGDDIDRQQPVLIKFFERKKVISMACGLDHSLVIADCTHGPF